MRRWWLCRLFVYRGYRRPRRGYVSVVEGKEVWDVYHDCVVKSVGEYDCGDVRVCIARCYWIASSNGGGDMITNEEGAVNSLNELSIERRTCKLRGGCDVIFD